MFGKKGNKLAITIEAKPETLVKGSNTYRVHHVVEGCSSTVDPRAASDVSPSKTTGIGVATSISTMGQAFETMGKGYPTAKSAVLLIVVIGFMCFLIGLLLGVSPLIKK